MQRITPFALPLALAALLGLSACSTTATGTATNTAKSADPAAAVVSDKAASNPATAPTVSAAASAPSAALSGAEFSAAMAKQPGAVKSETGLIYIPLKEGTGAKASIADTVTVHYRGTLTDGTEFDSSYKRNSTAQFPLSRVIPCWTQGVQMMKIGGRAKLVCPPHLAYGVRGAGSDIPPDATLVFEIELVGIKGR